MDLNELYKEIEKAEIDLNAKRLKYIKEALVENGGSIKLKFKKWGEDNNAFDFDDQFPVIIEIAGIPMFLTEVYVKKNGFRMAHEQVAIDFARSEGFSVSYKHNSYGVRYIVFTL